MHVCHNVLVAIILCLREIQSAVSVGDDDEVCPAGAEIQLLLQVDVTVCTDDCNGFQSGGNTAVTGSIPRREQRHYACAADADTYRRVAIGSVDEAYSGVGQNKARGRGQDLYAGVDRPAFARIGQRNGGRLRRILAGEDGAAFACVGQERTGNLRWIGGACAAVLHRISVFHIALDAGDAASSSFSVSASIVCSWSSAGAKRSKEKESGMMRRINTS